MWKNWLPWENLKRGSRDYLEKKNIITRAVGVSAQVDTDLFALKLKSGDQILMCSDGLSNMVDELEIEYIIRSRGWSRKPGKSPGGCSKPQRRTG
ncbi:MAG: hypothetical protein ACLUD2_17790 [Clostridium sp.]